MSMFEKLANISSRHSASGHLDLLGKRAAGSYMRKEADSLSSAVASVVAEEKLNPDQVHRVVQTANQSTWQSMFHDGGQTDTTFAPADVSDVLGALSEKPETYREDRGSDYLGDVPDQVYGDDEGLEDIFRVKVESPEYEQLNPAHAEQVTLDKVAGALDVARHGVDVAASHLAEAGEKFYQMVKQAHVTDELGLLQIAQAVGQAVDDPLFASTIMKQAGARLEREGVKFREREELTKLAHPMVVNTEHPLFFQAALVEKLAFAHYQADGTLETLRSSHAGAVKALQAKLRDAK